MRVNLFLLLSFCILIFSCGEDTKENKEIIAHTGVKAQMISKSGELFEGNPFIPFPLNHAFVTNENMDTLDVLILGTSIEEVETYFEPFALIDLLEDGVKRQMIIGLPELQKYRALESNDFANFMIKNHAIKSIIDTFFGNYKGLGRTRISRWQDGIRAEAILNSFIAGEGSESE